MRIHWTAIAGMAVMLSTAGHAQTNRLSAAAEAMGATTLNSIQFTGSGNVFSFGQAFEPGERWPRFMQRVYNAAINYQTPAMRVIQVRSQGEHPPRGGGAQAVGPTSVRSRWSAANSPGRKPATRRFPIPPRPAIACCSVGDAPWRDQGGAGQCGASVDGNTVTVGVDGREFKATLNAQNLVEKVSYLSTNEVVGDYPSTSPIPTTPTSAG